MNKDWDERERKMSPNPEELIKQIMPLLQRIMIKPPKVEFFVNGSQLKDLGELIKKWEGDPDG